MASLYCLEDGTARRDKALAEHRGSCSGDMVRYTTGRLTSGPWRCDKCNADLRVGDEAIFFRVLYDGPDDCAYESEYMDLDKSKVDTVFIPQNEKHENFCEHWDA